MSNRAPLVYGIAFGLIASSFGLQAQTIYKLQQADGRTVYSDKVLRGTKVQKEITDHQSELSVIAPPASVAGRGAQVAEDQVTARLTQRDQLWRERNLELTAITTGRRLAPVHPGEVLLKEFIEPMKLTRYKVAKGTGVPQRRIDEICSGSRGMTADTALRLARLFGVEAQFWMNLQARYDLEVAERESRKRIEREVTPLKEAA